MKTNVKTNGCEIKAAIERIQKRIETLNATYATTLWRFDDEDKPSPTDTLAKLERAEQTLCYLQHLQRVYNQHQEVEVVGVGVMPLNLAINLRGPAGRQAKRWRNLANDTGTDRYSRQDVTRDKDTIQAKRQVSADDCLDNADKYEKIHSAFRNAIARGNQVEFEVGQVTDFPGVMEELSPEPSGKSG